MNERPGIMTSSSTPTPTAFNARCKPVVQLETATAYFAFTYDKVMTNQKFSDLFG